MSGESEPTEAIDELASTPSTVTLAGTRADSASAGRKTFTRARKSHEARWTSRVTCATALRPGGSRDAKGPPCRVMKVPGEQVPAAPVVNDAIRLGDSKRLGAVARGVIESELLAVAARRRKGAELVDIDGGGGGLRREDGLLDDVDLAANPGRHDLFQLQQGAQRGLF